MKLTLTLLLSLLAFSSYAGLSDLPFDFIPGTTHNDQVEEKGICVKRIEIRPTYFLCEEFTINGNGFKVFSTQKEIVSKIIIMNAYENISFDFNQEHPINGLFMSYASERVPAKMPRKWKQIGLEFNTDFDEIVNILNTENVEDLIITGSKFSKKVTFVLNDVNYQFEILKIANGSHYDLKDGWNILRITLTEAY